MLEAVGVKNVGACGQGMKCARRISQVDIDRAGPSPKGSGLGNPEVEAELGSAVPLDHRLRVGERSRLDPALKGQACASPNVEAG